LIVSDLKGLHAFGKAYPEAQRFCLYRGDEMLTVDGVRFTRRGVFEGACAEYV
jgi:hypothetical protein